MGNLCLRGGIRTSQYGTVSVYLFPFPGQGPRDFKHLVSPELERLFADYFYFFRSGKTVGRVNGKHVTIEKTRRIPSRKIMRFSLSFMEVTMLEDIKTNDETKALLFINLPFHDPAVPGQELPVEGNI